MFGGLKFQKKLLDEYGLQVRLRMLVKKCVRGMRRFVIIVANIFGLKNLLISIFFKLKQCKFFISNTINLAPKTNRKRYIYVDISGIIREDLRTGIQRVVRGLLGSLSASPPVGYEIKPVYAKAGSLGFHHTECLADVNNNSEACLCGSLVCPESGDIFLGLDFQVGVVLNQKAYLDRLNRQGLKVFFIVYDLLPIHHPEWFPDHAYTGHKNWLDVVSKYNGVACISKKVASDFSEWLIEDGTKKSKCCRVGWFHLGANFDGSLPTSGFPSERHALLDRFKKVPTFLMVGTLEPRKGHMQILKGFTELWEDGVDVNLVIVGKQGWKVHDLVCEINEHRELKKKLFWIDVASDEFLEEIFSVSTCLIAASYEEGFGLPLIEAAHAGLPIIARDIPVFREVAGDGAYYFVANCPLDFKNHVEEWLTLFSLGAVPDSNGIKYLSWDESARGMIHAIGIRI